MLYPSHSENLNSTPIESVVTSPLRELDGMRAGYAYAHIGSALSLIDSVASGRASGVNEVITTVSR
jgi:uncharacterized NAD(P)/FAD-binding protein YdhS